MRKTLVALLAAGALGVSSAALAAGHGHGAGGGGGGGGSAMASHGSVGMSGPAMSGKSVGGPGWGNPNLRTTNIGRPGWGATNFKTTSFKSGNFTRNAVFHNRFHRFHNRNAFFFGVGFAGPYYDSCWRLVPTYWGGWQRVWVCGYDYPYWGY